MFKKQPGNLKASGPLPDLDRRKFKQRVVAAFGVSQDECNQLVPEGLQSIKFSTYLNKQGVAYLGPEGDPFWFTIGKDSDELIPTIYTLWKKRDLVPFVSTPPSVIRVLVGGADHGVIQRPTQSIAKDQLVSICQYDRKEGQQTLSAPLVIGRMVISSDRMTEGGKGKAVLVLHAWKDHLWDMGSKLDVPEPTVIAEATHTSSPPPPPPAIAYTPQEVTDILHKSLLHSISTIFSSLPVSGFPIPSTQFYTNHILPCRPATTTNDVTIKNSTYKSLTAFLKAAEKDSLLILKSQQKQKGLLVMFVNRTHSSVLGLVNYETVRDAEEKNAKRVDELGVRLLWKPHLKSTHLFESIGGDPETLYTMQEIKTLLDSYISSRNLDKAKDKTYINLDDLLRECIHAKQAMAGDEDEDVSLLGSEFIRREGLVKKVVAKMQDWYEIVRNGETYIKQGTLEPIQVQIVTSSSQSKIKHKARRRIKVIRLVKTKAGLGRNLKPNQGVTKESRLGRIAGGLKPNRVLTKASQGRKGTLRPNRVLTKGARYGKKRPQPNKVVTKAGQDVKAPESANKVTVDDAVRKIMTQYAYKVVSTRKTSQKKGKRKGTPKKQKASTSTEITGFEPFVTVEAVTMAHEFRRMCVCATSVSPLPGKKAGKKVMVQGKQSKAALEFLTSHGVPKQWIELVDS